MLYQVLVTDKLVGLSAKGESRYKSHYQQDSFHEK